MVYYIIIIIIITFRISLSSLSLSSKVLTVRQQVKRMKKIRGTTYQIFIFTSKTTRIIDHTIARRYKRRLSLLLPPTVQYSS